MVATNGRPVGAPVGTGCSCVVGRPSEYRCPGTVIESRLRLLTIRGAQDIAPALQPSQRTHCAFPTIRAHDLQMTTSFRPLSAPESRSGHRVRERSQTCHCPGTFGARRSWPLEVAA